MKSFIIAVILAAFSVNVYALNSSSCSSLIYNNGWWRKYPALGIGETGLNKMFKTTSHGSSGSTDWSSQSTTAAIDPGVSTKASQSFTQSVSSWGPCSLIGSADDMRKLRELYYAQNKDGFLKELAQGNGEHLEVMAFFGRCDAKKQKEFNRAMQGNYLNLIQDVRDDKKFMDKFDYYLNSLECKVS